MAERHMNRVLGDSEAAASAAKECMRSYGRYWAEVLWIRKSRAPRMRRDIRVEGLQHVIEARRQGLGMIYGLPHIGNWEAAAPIAADFGVEIIAVAENLPNRHVTNWFTVMRAAVDIEIVLATKSREVMRSLESGLAANKVVALMADRDIKGRGVKVTFFGEETTMPAGPAALAIKTGAPLFPVAAYFDGAGHCVVIRPRIPIPETGSKSDRVRVMTQQLTKQLELLIRHRPNQWHLVQPNWPSDTVER